MADCNLSQDEINALLSGADDAAESINSNPNPKHKKFKYSKKSKKKKTFGNSGGIEVLSQDEIDNLLSAVEMEDFGKDTPNSNLGGTDFGFGVNDDCGDSGSTLRNSATVKMYDFKRPDKFSKDNLRTIHNMFEIFARLTTTSLSAQLRSFVNIHVASIDQLTYEEFGRSIPNPTTLALINIDPLKGCGLMELDPTITFAMIDRLFGGEGESIKENRELTDIEQSVMEGILIRMLGNLRESFQNIIDLKPKLGNIETNIQFAQIVPPRDMIVLITMEARIGEVEGMINFCLPYITLEPIVNKLSGIMWYSQYDYGVQEENNEFLVNTLLKAPLELKVILGKALVPAKTIINLKKKDQIRLDNKHMDATFPICITGKHKFNCIGEEMSKCDIIKHINEKKFKITEVIELPKQNNEEGYEEDIVDDLTDHIVSEKENEIKNLKQKLEGSKKNINHVKLKLQEQEIVISNLNKSKEILKNELLEEIKREEQKNIPDIKDSEIQKIIKIDPKIVVKIIRRMLNEEDGKHDGGQEAAFMLIILGQKYTAILLKHLREEEIEVLTFEMARIDYIEPQRIKQSLKEFQGYLKTQNLILEGGIEYAKETLEKSLGHQKAMDIVNRLTSSLQVHPFAFVRRTDPVHLFNFLRSEHPQTIALVLSFLEDTKAKEVLELIEPEYQAEIVKRIAKMDRVTPEILREIERVLERKLSTIASEDFTNAGGIEQACEVVKQANKQTQGYVIEVLQEEDPELGEEIRKRVNFQKEPAPRRKSKKQSKFDKIKKFFNFPR